MRCAVLVLLVACGGAVPADRAGAAEDRGRPVLGMNDVSILLPLPRALGAPVIAGLDEALIDRGWYDALVAARGDIGPRTGGAIAFEDFQVVAVRFDLCDRAAIGACPREGAGRLRLDPARRRVGLAQDAAGAIYSAYFVGGRGKPPAGGVALVTIAGAAATETEIASGFHKAVGVAATPAAVFVSDQTDRAIFQIAVPGYAVSRLASVPAVDLLAMLPNGDLLTGGGPTISRITPRGEVTTLPGGGFEQVRGLAYDAAGHRLFVVDHSVTVGLPDKLRILHLAG